MHIIQVILIDTGLVYLELKEMNENVGREICILLKILSNFSRRECRQKKQESQDLSNP